jgi:flagellar basal body rod protein FlgG
MVLASLFGARVALGSDGSGSTTPSGAAPSAARTSPEVAPPDAKAVPRKPGARPKRIRKTGRALDLAIQGDGYFQLMRADDPRDLGMYVTRLGRFHLDDQGHLVLSAAKRHWILTPSLQVNHESALIEITNDGQVWVTDVDDLTKPGDHREIIGTIMLMCFSAETTLPPCGDGIYRVSRKAAREGWIGAPGSEGRGQLRQGCLEESNVGAQERRDDSQ